MFGAVDVGEADDFDEWEGFAVGTGAFGHIFFSLWPETFRSL